MAVIYRSLTEVGRDFGPCALTIGNFDGVHAGHRRICREVAGLAGRHGWKASALTFDPHPARIVAPDRAPRLLTTPEQRARLMAGEGIEQVLILPFTKTFSMLSPEDFVKKILVDTLDARAVLVGDNFRFGHGHVGDTRLLRQMGAKYGFATVTADIILCRGVPVSSSEVRRTIEAGGVARAMRYLERPYSIEGEVVPGEGVGARRTVPTLNLATAAEVLPGRGVYITRTTELGRPQAGGLRHVWPSVTNIGYRPTFGGDKLTIETFLLEPLLGETPGQIRLEFLYRLRDERKFENAEALKAQIFRDVNRARKYFRLVQSDRQVRY